MVFFDGVGYNGERKSGVKRREKRKQERIYEKFKKVYGNGFST